MAAYLAPARLTQTYPNSLITHWPDQLAVRSACLCADARSRALDALAVRKPHPDLHTVCRFSLCTTQDVQLLHDGKATASTRQSPRLQWNLTAGYINGEFSTAWGTRLQASNPFASDQFPCPVVLVALPWMAAPASCTYRALRLN
jgi:hypothetical protein